MTLQYKSSTKILYILNIPSSRQETVVIPSCAVDLKKLLLEELYDVCGVAKAWEKFHECYHTFSLGPSSGKEEEFRSVHLCEAPGAFITSLNHALVAHHPGTGGTTGVKSVLRNCKRI